MAKFVPDVTTNRWVIIAEGRQKRPQDTQAEAAWVKKICVFCPGFEKIPGDELFRIGSGASYETGWDVRVIKNKYPITDFHEVIIHSPDNEVDLDQLPLPQVQKVLTAFRARFNANRDHGHVIIFNNVGEAAGASLRHPHSQLVVIPKQIDIEMMALEPIQNIVHESKNFVTYCPDFSQWPFEMWIAPKARNKFFGDVEDAELVDLAGVLQDSLKRVIYHLTSGEHYHPGMPMVKFKEGPAYNFYIYSGQDWYLRIIPRLIHRAGFELGTGLQVNIVDPADASQILSEDIKNAGK